MEQVDVSTCDLAFALKEFRGGRFVLIYDSMGRENEVDMVVAAELVSPEHVKVLRRDAGGLLCVALGCEVGEKLGIASMRDILLFAAHQYPVLKLLDEENAPYGGKSAFSITINHRRTFTGVTDRDRALTITELAKLSRTAVDGGEDLQRVFATEFKAPGHVNLLLESQGSLAQRRGHTELSIYLCRLAGMAPAAAICEMLDGKTHNALSVEDARRYGRTHSIPLLEGQQLIGNFQQPSKR